MATAREAEAGDDAPPARAEEKVDQDTADQIAMDALDTPAADAPGEDASAGSEGEAKQES